MEPTEVPKRDTIIGKIHSSSDIKRGTSSKLRETIAKLNLGGIPDKENVAKKKVPIPAKRRVFTNNEGEMADKVAGETNKIPKKQAWPEQPTGQQQPKLIHGQRKHMMQEMLLKDFSKKVAGDKPAVSVKPKITRKPNVTETLAGVPVEDEIKTRQQGDETIKEACIKRNTIKIIQHEIDGGKLRQSIMKLHRRQNGIEDEMRKIIQHGGKFDNNETFKTLKDQLTKYRTETNNLQDENNIKVTDLMSASSLARATKENDKPPFIPKRKREKSQPNYENVEIVKKRPALPPDELTRKQESGVHPHVGLKPADDRENLAAIQDTWQCPNCDFINDAQSVECDVCNQENNAFTLKLTAAIKRQHLEKIQPKAEDTWKCAQCTYENALQVNICGICGKTREAFQPLKTIIQENTYQPDADMWICTYCTVKNFPNLKICSVCAKTRGIATKAKKTGWKCRSCNQLYPDEMTECPFCTKHGGQDLEKGWICENCTYENASGSKICDMCDYKPKMPPPSVEEVMKFGNFKRETVEGVLRNMNGDIDEVCSVLILHHLQPIHVALWDEDSGEMGESPTDITDKVVLTALQDQNIDNERRVRMVLVEGSLGHFVRAEAAIALIDDPELLGEVEELTIQHILDGVKGGFGDVQECKKRLVEKCAICFYQFASDQLHQLTFCDCLSCAGCLSGTFEVLIRDKNVVEWTCQICKKPDLKIPEIREGHFMFLDIKLNRFLKRETYSIFTKKLAEWNLQQTENFVWCANETCSNGFLGAGRRKAQCKSCQQYMCWKCKKPWLADHDNRTCEELVAYLQTKEEQQGIKKQLQKDGIVCPSCKYQFDLARGGCMHFTCTQCQHQFCCGCYREHGHGSAKGLNCDHPRDCLYYLRDKDKTWLEDLLKRHNHPYEFQVQNLSPKCQVMELKDDQIQDEPCGKPVQAYGLCQEHYKEHLVRIINQHRLDPAEKYDINEVKIVMRRENLQYEEKPVNITEMDHLMRMKTKIQQKLPLQQRPY